MEFTLNRDIEAAANDVRDAISGVADRLPDEADPPEVEKADSDSDTIIWLNMSSPTMDTLELSDYADRYIVDRLSSLDGVAQVRLGGRQRYAMRIWRSEEHTAAPQSVMRISYDAFCSNTKNTLPSHNID